MVCCSLPYDSLFFFFFKPRVPPQPSFTLSFPPSPFLSSSFQLPSAFLPLAPSPFFNFLLFSLLHHLVLLLHTFFPSPPFLLPLLFSFIPLFSSVASPNNPLHFSASRWMEGWSVGQLRSAQFPVCRVWVSRKVLVVFVVVLFSASFRVFCFYSVFDFCCCFRFPHALLVIKICTYSCPL